MSFRRLKKEMSSLLVRENADTACARLMELPGRRIVNPLFSLFHSGDDRLRWRAITAMGIVVARLADQEIESARVVMRRLMWTLNDESGGIGWGSPEAMGEIMARHQRLADEYACVLVSYVNESGNYLEHEILQRGALWGVGRLARISPGHVAAAGDHIAPYLRSADHFLRGLSLWAVTPLKLNHLETMYASLTNDTNRISLYEND
ncbi:MAG: hypothetical protein HKM93_17480, partial [Desulfobacteraceae bacterium]|nr:hypothetical protein [Desulfobacteraceae bacterium]